MLVEYIIGEMSAIGALCLMKRSTMNRLLSWVSILILTLMSTIDSDANDLIPVLAGKQNFGPKIKDGLIITISFTGTPATPKQGQRFKGISGDAVIANADLPLSSKENVVAYSSTTLAQNLTCFSIELKNPTEWAKVSRREPNPGTAGELTIMAYSKQFTPGYSLVFWWKCSTACLANYVPSTGNANFVIVGGSVEWICKRSLAKTDWLDTTGSWSNAIPPVKKPKEGGI